MKTQPTNKTKLAPMPIKPEIKDTTREFAEREIRDAALLVVDDLDTQERAFLRTCQMLYREDGGCDTPFQSFFGDLVRRIRYGYWPSPDDVREDLREFDENWNSMYRVAKRFSERYAKHYRKATEAEAERADAA